MILCTVVIAALLFYSTSRSMSVFSTLSGETGNYIVRQKAAHELMEASDYLTEMVQRFTLEGDTKYLDSYFEEAFVSKRRESAIMSMAEGDTDPELVLQLQEAMDESQTLMYREYYAMKLVTEARGIQDCPDTLKAIELKEGDAFLTPEEKLELAHSMVMGPDYYASKGVIRTRLKENLEAQDRKLNEARQRTTSDLMMELNRQRIVIAALILVLAGLIFLTARLSTMPLMDAVRRIRRRERLDPVGSREFRQLAESYNEMFESLHPTREEEPEEQA